MPVKFCYAKCQEEAIIEIIEQQNAENGAPVPYFAQDTGSHSAPDNDPNSATPVPISQYQIFPPPTDELEPGKPYLVNFTARVEVNDYIGSGGVSPVTLRVGLEDGVNIVTDLWIHDFTADGEQIMLSLSYVFTTDPNATVLRPMFQTANGSGATPDFLFTNGAFNIVQLD